jgi:hypothetical protein
MIRHLNLHSQLLHIRHPNVHQQRRNHTDAKGLFESLTSEVEGERGDFVESGFGGCRLGGEAEDAFAAGVAPGEVEGCVLGKRESSS